MRWMILIGIVTLFIAGCGLSEQRCKDVALEEAQEWQDLGYVAGMDRGIEICENNYKPMLEQFEPPENCIIVLLGDNMMRFVCEGDKYYEELREKNG